MSSRPRSAWRAPATKRKVTIHRFALKLEFVMLKGCGWTGYLHLVHHDEIQLQREVMFHRLGLQVAVCHTERGRMDWEPAPFQHDDHAVPRGRLSDLWRRRRISLSLRKSKCVRAHGVVQWSVGIRFLLSTLRHLDAFCRFKPVSVLWRSGICYREPLASLVLQLPSVQN